MIIPNKDFKDEFTNCCFNKESEVMTRRSGFLEVPVTKSFNNNGCELTDFYKDNIMKLSSFQINEEYEIMDGFLNNMKE